MIGINGQWLMTINGKEIESAELEELRVIDEAGLGLPILEFSFHTKDFNKFKDYCTPGKTVELGIGKKTIDAKMDFVVFRKAAGYGSTGDQYNLRVWCIQDTMKYLDTQKMRTFENEDSLKKSDEVWTSVWGEYGWIPDTISFDDKMMWIQYNITDRQFLNEVTTHGFYAKDDPCLIALRRDKKAVYKPLSLLKM